MGGTERGGEKQTVYIIVPERSRPVSAPIASGVYKLTGRTGIRLYLSSIVLFRDKMDIAIQHPWFRRSFWTSFFPTRIFDQHFGEHISESDVLAPYPSLYFPRPSFFRWPSWVDSGLSEVSKSASFHFISYISLSLSISLTAGTYIEMLFGKGSSVDSLSFIQNLQCLYFLTYHKNDGVFTDFFFFCQSSEPAFNQKVTRKGHL